MRIVALVVLMVSAAAAAASPREVAQTKALLEKQRTAIVRDDADAFIAVFTASPLVIFPGATEVSDDEQGLRAVFLHQFGTPDEPSSHAISATWKDVKIVALGAGTGAVVSANLNVEWAGGDVGTSFRVTELLIATPDDALRVLAAHVSIGISTREAVANLDDAKYRPVPFPGAQGNASADKLLTHPAQLAAALLSNPNVIVLGTDTKERAVGAAAKKMLTSWKSLKLAVDGGVRTGSIGESGLGYLAANISLTSGKHTLPFRVLAFTRENPETGAPTILALHFSSPSYGGY